MPSSFFWLRGHSAWTPSQTDASSHGSDESAARQKAPDDLTELPLQQGPPNSHGLGLLKHDPSFAMWALTRSCEHDESLLPYGPSLELETDGYIK